LPIELPKRGNLPDRILTTVAFLFLSAATVILAIVPPSAGYEISIYDAYPLSFWFCILTSVSCGISSLVYISFRQGVRSSWWSFAALAVICSNIVVLLIPTARDYFLIDRSDTANAFAQVRYTAITGHLGSGNMYPMLHSFIYTISTTGGLDFQSALALLLIVFYSLYVGGVYLIAKELETKPKQSILIVTFGSVLLFGYFNSFLIPTQLFLFLIPTVLFFVFRRNNHPKEATNIVVLLLFCVTLPFVHPFGSIMLILFLLEFEVARRLRGWLYSRNSDSTVWNYTLPKLARNDYHSLRNRSSGSTEGADERRRLLSGPTIGLAMILFIAFFVWYSYFWRFIASVRQAYNWFFLGTGTPYVEKLTVSWSKSGLGLVDFLRLLFLTYGQMIIYLALSLAAFYLIVREIRGRKTVPSVVELFLPLVIVSSILLFAASQVADFISGIGSGFRILNYGLFGAMLLNGIVFFNWIHSLNNKKIKVYATFLLLLLLVTSAFVGIFNTYDSTTTLQANGAISRMGAAGATFLIGHRGNYTTLQFDDWISNADLILNGWDGVYVYRYQYQNPPARLGYANGTSLSTALSASSYVVVDQRIVDFKTVLWPTQGYFTLDDLNRLAKDQSVEKIYSNGEVYIGFVPVQGQ
jgi:hypothetical protein